MTQWVKILNFLQDQKKIPLLMISVDVTRITWFLQNSLSSKYDISTPQRALRPLSTIGIGGVGQHKRHTLQIPVFWVVQEHPPQSKLNFACDIMYSQVVTHPSTNMTQCCLTSVIGRERVLSTWYGHRQDSGLVVKEQSPPPSCKKKTLILPAKSCIPRWSPN